jgi:formylglycine-generating enzyme required for sulfatase activity
MVPLPMADAEPSAARVCIDRFEFPNIPCEYPVVWVTARQAMDLCAAVGKRICDAHEWEGACAGELRAPEVEYPWSSRRIQMRHDHNQERQRIWAYGSREDHSLCATGGRKSPTCASGGYRRCGSNTYPAGSFPECVSQFGVYDQHGNVAEHMNLPLKRDQLASIGGAGETEMKGSWFVFAEVEAHEDDCRWRAPAWHASKIDAHESHLNYHLGFRCCKDVE